MNVLIIGGTRFQGRYLVAALLEGGHHVTVFHTGGHPAAAAGKLVDLVGDRNQPAHLERIAGTAFDVCIDTCAYLPRQVELLRSRLTCRLYCLISSVHVYLDQAGILPESAPLVPVDGLDATTFRPENYGALKVLCERMAMSCFGDRCAVVRPSMMIGPGDHTGRLAFWTRMIGKHRKTVVGDALEGPVQFIDVRDLAAFVVRMVENGHTGAVNVAGAAVRLDDVVRTLVRLSGAECRLASVSRDGLARAGLAGLPYLDWTRRATFSSERARTWGLEIRDLADSLADVYRDEQRQGFASERFLDLEAGVLRLFD